jgi:hypothetical protein
MAKSVREYPVMEIDATYLEPGIYRSIVDMYMPHHNDYIDAASKCRINECFVVSKHIEKIGTQQPYQYYAIKRLKGSEHYLVKSYETKRWNSIAPFMEKMSF